MLSMSHSRSKPVTTRLDSDIYVKTRSEEQSQIFRGNSSTLKTRIDSYKRNLITSRGLGKPLYDDQLMELVLKYANNQSAIRKEIDYLNRLVDEDGNLFSRNLKEYKKISSQLKGFISVNHKNFFWNQHYKLALKQVAEKLYFKGLKALKYHSDEDILNVLPKASTHSGFTYLLSGKRCKGDNIVGLTRKLCKHLEEVRDAKRLGIPNLIAFRTQASGEYDAQGNQTNTCKHKTRMVAMVDLVVIANELQFSHPFMSHFRDVRSFAGGKDDREIASIISDMRSRFKYHTSMDYSQFDQSISDWLIRDAFDLVRNCFVLEGEDTFKFECVVNDFINKDFLIDKGLVRSNKGVPSGSMFTQIIGSLVNQIVLHTYLNSIGSYGEMMVMGDDNLVFTRDEIDLDHLSSYVLHNFGLIINPSKSSQGSYKDDPEFLSRRWTSLGPTRAWQAVLSRMAFPERFRTYNDQVQPSLVLYAYYLTYKSVEEIIDVRKFISDYKLNRSEVLNVDSRYIPGVMAYIKEYELD
jgi:hypothetical protein